MQRTLLADNRLIVWIAMVTIQIFSIVINRKTRAYFYENLEILIILILITAILFIPCMLPRKIFIRIFLASIASPIAYFTTNLMLGINNELFSPSILLAEYLAFTWLFGGGLLIAITSLIFLISRKAIRN